VKQHLGALSKGDSGAQHPREGDACRRVRLLRTHQRESCEPRQQTHERTCIAASAGFCANCSRRHSWLRAARVEGMGTLQPVSANVRPHRRTREKNKHFTTDDEISFRTRRLFWRKHFVPPSVGLLTQSLRDPGMPFQSVTQKCSFEKHSSDFFCRNRPGSLRSNEPTTTKPRNPPLCQLYPYSP